nr:DUF4232 domain-containing protein [Micromonospora sp. DSM 115978]
FGPAPSGPPAQYDVPVLFTNSSDVECTLTGYPGAMLRSSDGAGYDLPRSTRVPADRVVVPPGGTAQATLTYLGAEPSASGVFVPETVVVTPPDQFDQIVLTWPFGPVLDQSGATRPGTYISAISTVSPAQ